MVIRLLAALTFIFVAFLWVRGRAAARFRRRLRRSGLPNEVAVALARDYRATVPFRNLSPRTGRLHQ